MSPLVRPHTRLRLYAPSSSSKGSPGLSSSRGSVLAGPSVVCGSSVFLGWPPMGDPGPKRYSLSSEGDDISSPARDMETLCLAPEGSSYDFFTTREQRLQQNDSL